MTMAGLRPDPQGELKRSPGPLAAVGAMEGNTLAAVRGALWRRKEGGEVRLKDRSLMRRVTSKSVIARDIVFMSKLLFGGRAPPGPAERD